jgi:hypothetical protein
MATVVFDPEQTPKAPSRQSDQVETSSSISYDSISSSAKPKRRSSSPTKKSDLENYNPAIRCVNRGKVSKED